METLSRDRGLVGEPEVRLGLSCLLMVGILLVAGVARLPDDLRLVMVVSLSTGLALTLTGPLAALLGVTAWALLTGFVVNQQGLLTFTHGDVVRLLLVPALALFASRVGGSAPQ